MRKSTSASVRSSCDSHARELTVRVRCRGGDGEDREQLPACIEHVHRAPKKCTYAALDQRAFGAARDRLELRELGAGREAAASAGRVGVARAGLTYAKGCKKSGVGGLQSFNF